MSHDPMSVWQEIWGNMASPFAMDPAQLDKKIEDLQQVQQWLRINLQMIDTSLVALQAQRQFMNQWQPAKEPLAPAAPQPKTQSAADSTAMPAMHDMMQWWQSMLSAANNPNMPSASSKADASTPPTNKTAKTSSAESSGDSTKKPSPSASRQSKK